MSTDLPMSPHERRRAWWSAAAAIGVTYFYFLLFAEFALLEIVASLGGVSPRLLLAALGAGGLLGAALGASISSPERRHSLLAWSLRGCAVGAGLAMMARGAPLAFVAATVSGLSLGLLTVTLAASLAGATEGRRLGLCIGLGSGLAYAACNFPPLYHASPRTQALVSAVVAVATSFAVSSSFSRRGIERMGLDFNPAGVARWTAILLALVWMDSAAFYIIQHTPALRAAAWSTTGTLYANGLIHLLAALAAGVLIDRHRRALVVAAATALLAIASLMLGDLVPAFVAPSWLYAAGVSLYSVALVEYPARSGRAGIAALTYAVAGWIGSAMGIGMAQDLTRIPVTFVVGAGAAVVLALLLRRRALRLLPASTLLALGVVAAGHARAAEPSFVVRGKEVYISEGCIHCHSQYVRPLAPLDSLRWGPAAPLDSALAGTPPLVGTRRQGPDLANVGNRRSAEWQKLHLVDPQAVSPGSRMPSYAHLFKPGDDRGDALVAYLLSLGAATREAREAQIATWQPAPEAPLPLAESARRFQQLCAQCHGASGHGDGAFASRLSYRPPDWSLSVWHHVQPGADVELALARIIKFGIAGLPMAGHEYLPDGDVLGLARYVQTLRPHPNPSPAVAAQP